jgi:hypothetical protein
LRSSSATTAHTAGCRAIRGSPASLTVTRAAETWQFFAFVFAAAVTLTLALIEDIPHAYWRIAAKVVSFFGLVYLLLINVRVRNWLAGLLGTFKEEGR